VQGDDPRGCEVEAPEELGDLGLGPGGDVDALGLVGADEFGDLVGIVVGGQVRHRQVAAGRERVDQRADDAVLVVLDGDEMQDGDDRQGDGLGQVDGVQEFLGGQDASGVTQVGVQVGGPAPRIAGEQSAGMGEHDRYHPVVAHVY
jgi:hypothetical protein